MSKKLLISVLALTMVGGGPGLAAEDKIQQLETSVQKAKQSLGTNPGAYYSQLQNLVLAYMQVGRTQDAQRYCEELDSYYRKQPDGNKKLSQMYFNFSETLRWNPKARLKRPSAPEGVDPDADALVIKAADLVKNESIYTSEKTSAYLMAIQLKASHWADMENELSKQISEEQKKSVLAPMQIYQLTRILDQLANESMNRNSPGGGPTELSQAGRLAQATSYKQRAMSFWNRLPAKDPARINAQRQLVRWYEAIGATTESEREKKNLSALLGSTDPAVLFPPPVQCLACGRG